MYSKSLIMVYSLKLKNKKLIDFLFYYAKRKGINICEYYQKEKEDDISQKFP